MKIARQARSTRGFTFWDVLAISVVLFLIGVWLLVPQMGTGCKARASRINCVNNLKQTALAFRMWANDHNEQFPMNVPMAQGGSAEFVAGCDVFQHFLVVSNELNSPKILACPVDKDRNRTASFTNFSNRDLSYFVNVDPTQQFPSTILAGDRNITGGVMSTECLMVVSSSATAGFTRDLHVSAANTALMDGSVMQATSDLLRRQLKSINAFPVRIAIPRVEPENTNAFWRSSLQKLGLWSLIGLSVLIAIAVYAGMTRRLVARASSG
jgi:hypothetical protein